MIRHHPTCRPDYPEKTPGEPARAVTHVQLGNGAVAIVCNDCGAHEQIQLSDMLDELIDAVVENCDTTNLDREAARAALYRVINGRM